MNIPAAVTNSPGNPLISVVMPAFNEDASLEAVVEAVVRALRAHAHEIILVDDGSTDRTWPTIEALKQRFSQIIGVRLTRNFGHQAAILAGLSVASGDAALTLDADGQHPPDCIPAFIARWQEGFMVVQGVRTATEGESAAKRWTSRAFYRLLRAVGGPDVPIGSADYRLLGRTAIAAVLESAGPLPFLRGLIPWLGYPVAYVPFHAGRRHGGVTGYTWWRMVRFSVHGLLSFTIVPLRFSMLLGLAVAAFSFLYLVATVAAWFVTDTLVPGWASLMGLLSLLGGIQLITIGVLGEYVGRVFVAQLKRPQFVVRERL